MSFVQEIEKMMNSLGNSLDYRIVNLGGKSVYVEGIKTVDRFGEDEMIFQMKKQQLVINGENLKIKYLDKDTCIVSGNIKQVGTK